VPGLRERWVWAQREWARVTTDTGVGNPKDATAEKGAKFAAAVTEKIAAFLVALAAAEPDSLYETD
jgi:creatinine amidohydrolase